MLLIPSEAGTARLHTVWSNLGKVDAPKLGPELIQGRIANLLPELSGEPGLSWKDPRRYDLE